MADIQVFGGENEKTILSLVREIAMDIYPVETILANHSLTAKDLETYMKIPRFQQMLTEARAAWSSAGNVDERIRLKHLSMVEEAAPEMFRLLHDPNQPLSGKVELYKTLMKGGGVGVTTEGALDTGRVSITINMGAAADPVRVSATLAPVIDGEVLDQ